MFGKLGYSAVSGLLLFPEQRGSCTLKPMAPSCRRADPYRFKLGVVPNTGNEPPPFGDRLWALPHSELWT